jgi:hypothetical protein
MSLIVPLLIKELQVFAGSLLNFNIHVISELLDHFLSCGLNNFAQANSELGQSSEDPTYYGVTTFTLSGVILKDPA